MSKLFNDWRHDPEEVGELLRGRTLLTAVLDDDELVLQFADGVLRYRAVGDCCSYSWVEHLTVPDLGAGAEVLGWQDSDPVYATDEQHAECKGHRSEYVDELRVYSTAIVTTAGEVVVEFRNSSNGYYGGWLSLVEDSRT